MNIFLNLSSAFGLSGAAGLNAYIPMLLLSILANQHVIRLAHPYDVIGKPWCVAILAVLCVIELIIDKVPGGDHVNDAIQTFIRPTAGAILFASQMGTITHVHPGVWITIGLLFAGGVHAVKTVARPVVNVSTLGIGGPVVSVVEDGVSTIMSLLAFFAPVFVMAAMIAFGWILWKLFLKVKRWRRPLRVEAVPMAVTAMRVEPLALPEMAGWSGGM